VEVFILFLHMQFASRAVIFCQNVREIMHVTWNKTALVLLSQLIMGGNKH
jgi:hypothetical protein